MHFVYYEFPNVTKVAGFKFKANLGYTVKPYL